MKRSGTADLPLHYGYVPRWLAERMARMSLAISESIVTEYGQGELLKRLSDPFWFQSFGAVMGMDWHSSGITTSVLGAMKRAINPHAQRLGIFICGGKGRFSKQTPSELIRVAETTGLDGSELVRCSKLSAKIDNTAIQDGFQLYTHNFILASNGEWAVIQQGMRTGYKTARRYHWLSSNLTSFVEEPHTGICGTNQGQILNLTAADARITRDTVLGLTIENPAYLIKEFQFLKMPAHHDVRPDDINFKRLGTALWLAHQQQPANFEELILLNGVGPRTLQSLTLVSEIIHGTPSRFSDPARFSFAHGGKDGHPFPVPLNVYDETIQILQNAIEKAKLGNSEKAVCLKKLHEVSVKNEKAFSPSEGFEQLVQKERNESWKYGGRTVMSDAYPPEQSAGTQLRLF